jgi:hypothetical protein
MFMWSKVHKIQKYSLFRNYFNLTVPLDLVNNETKYINIYNSVHMISGGSGGGARALQMS